MQAKFLFYQSKQLIHSTETEEVECGASCGHVENKCSIPQMCRSPMVWISLDRWAIHIRELEALFEGCGIEGGNEERVFRAKIMVIQVSS